MILLPSWIAATQLVLPIGLLVWLGGVSPKAAQRGSRACPSPAASSGRQPWLESGSSHPGRRSLIYLALWLALGAAAWRQVHAKPWLPGGGRRAETALATMGAASLLSLALLGFAMSGWKTPAGDVAHLEFPLRDGTYLVVNGGSNLLLNLHLDPRFSPGQGYGIDVVKVDALGLRANGLLPSDPARYAIFGDLVHAPCTGAVAAPARTPPASSDRSACSTDHTLESQRARSLACGAYRS
jgi:hypothetical protein